MTGILARLTVTPLLWAAGLELVAIAVLGGMLYVQQSRVDVAQAASETAGARADAARTERDAWKQAAETSLGANVKWQSAFAAVQRLLREAQGENRRLAESGRKAIAAARAEAAEADRALAEWTHRYADQVRVGECAAALNAVQTACPAMEGY